MTAPDQLIICENSWLKHVSWLMPLIMLFTDGIVSYMKSKAGPSSKELVTVADAEKFLSSQEHGIVGKSSLSAM